MADWSSVASIAKLTIESAQAGGPAIYANGRHQAIIDVYVSPVSNERKELQFSEEELLKHIELVEYQTGEILGASASQGWSYSTKNNGFSTLNANGVAAAPRVNAARLYVTCSAKAQSTSLNVAVRLNLGNGKSVATSHGGVNGIDSKVTISTHPAIDYGKPEHWEVVDSPNGHFTDVVTDVNYLSLVRSDGNIGTWRNNFDATSRWKKVSIRSKLGFDIVDRGVTGTSIQKIDSLVDSATRFHTECTLKFESEPRAVSSWSGESNADSFFWFVEPTDPFGIKADSELAFRASNHWYRLHIGPNDDRHVKNPEATQNDAISVYLWNLRIPESGTHAGGWGDQLHDAYVRVQDKFGNEGTLKVSFHYDSWLPVLGR